MRDSDRFSKLPDGRVLDDSPMKDGGSPVVFDGKTWSVFKGTVGQFADSKPLSEEEETSFLISRILRFAELFRWFRPEQ